MNSDTLHTRHQSPPRTGAWKPLLCLLPMVVVGLHLLVAEGEYWSKMRVYQSRLDLLNAQWAKEVDQFVVRYHEMAKTDAATRRWDGWMLLKLDESEDPGFKTPSGEVLKLRKYQRKVMRGYTLETEEVMDGSSVPPKRDVNAYRWGALEASKASIAWDAARPIWQGSLVFFTMFSLMFAIPAACAWVITRARGI